MCDISPLFSKIKICTGGAAREYNKEDLNLCRNPIQSVKLQLNNLCPYGSMILEAIHEVFLAFESEIKENKRCYQLVVKSAAEKDKTQQF